MKHFIHTIFLIGFSMVLLWGCSNNSDQKLNLKKKSVATTNYQKDGKNITSIHIELKEPIFAKGKYLYLKGGQYLIDIVLNHSKDTIKFNEVQLTKKPFNQALKLREKELNFKLILIDADSLSSIEIIQHNRVPIKFARLKEILLINHIEYNELFRKKKELSINDFPLLQIKTSRNIYDQKQNATFELNNQKGANSITKSSCTIKIRGNTSKTFKKKGFKIELTDSVNRDRMLLGMPAEHDWVLHGPIKDISLLRNKFAYDLARSIDYYAPCCEFCELVVNNEYLGIYLLTESIKQDKNRVNIAKNDLSNDSLNSYIIKLDRGKNILFPSYFRSKINSGSKQFYNPVYPKAKKLKSQQKKQIKDDIYNIEKSFLSNNTALKYIDTVSFIDYLIINELTKNIDAYRLSTYLHKSRGEKLSIGPIWDFNFSLGLNKSHHGYQTTGWVYEGDAVPFWWGKLLENDEFKSLLSKRWFKLRKKELSIKTLYSSIDQYILELEPALNRNFYRWDVFNVDIWVRQNKVKNYEEEIELMKQFLKERINWMDEQMLVLKN